ncbi:MAG TPA: peroxiredoxin-like family protein [Aestuariivirgaceae bacterium]
MTQPSLAEVLEACTRRCRDMDAPLSARLSAFADEVRRLDPAFADVVDRMVNRLRQSKAGSPAPSTGDQMPPFVLPDEEGHLVSLTDLLKQGPVVVSFHRGHWCPYCRMSADALAKIDPQVRAAGARLVLITPEVQQFTRKFKADVNASFPILTDLDSGYALELSLAIKIDDEKRVAMTQSGWDIALFQDNQSWTLPIPATFVVGSDGLVKARFVDPDYRKRMETEDLLTALQ